MEHNAMEALQLEIGDWQDATFTEATALSKMSHLAKEVIELNRVLKEGDSMEILDELADCQHLLFGIASKCGINLYAGTVAKFEVNKNRKWGEPDENGVVEHLK
jgi:NTP pyrophosphatase (non-canonical NTP hydrolase)